jgi:RNA-directed DNA polymerase
MLKPKRQRKPRQKVDWFSAKQHPHFDHPMSRAQAEALVTSPALVSSHPFLPVIAFQKVDRRFRSNTSGNAAVSTKRRPLAYCANRDGHIFAYYAELLSKPYEKALTARGISGCVIAYRKIDLGDGRRVSNVELAREAFLEIQRRGPSVAVAIDIKGFFDNISHDVLKSAWCSLLETPRLPPDHFAVFRAITRFSWIDRSQCLERLGIRPQTSHAELLPRLGTARDFRLRIRGDGGSATNLIQTNCQPFKIPQGTPLSAMAANISMLEFDTEVAALARSLGGSYRRYSDDILLILPPMKVGSTLQRVQDLLTAKTTTLKMHSSKTQISRFQGSPLRARPKPLQYLGFTFDGQRVLVRDTTLSRFWRRMASGVRWAVKQQKRAQQGKINGRHVLHKRELLARYTHLGSESFLRGYARRAQTSMGNLADIPHQLRRHSAVLDRMIRKQQVKQRLKP